MKDKIYDHIYVVILTKHVGSYLINFSKAFNVKNKKVTNKINLFLGN